MFELLRFSTPDALADAAAEALLRQTRMFEESAAGGTFCVAVSGGRIAAHLFTAIARSPEAALLKSAPVHFFWADERCVPPDHPESNFGLAHKLLFGPAGIPTENVHRIKGELAPGLAAAEAEAELCRFAPAAAGQPVLDLVLLGMGEDGHVASLFPGEAGEVRDHPAVFRPVTSPKPPPWRITLGYGPIAAARQVWVLVSGPGKEAALRAALSAQASMPLAWVLRQREATRVLTDVV